jgi:enoyl-CoA hydratase
MGNDTAYLDVHNGYAELVLNRPEKLNAVNADLLHAIESCVDRAEEDRTVRALVVRGEGRAFCAGADLSDAAQRIEHPPMLTAFLDLWNGVFNRLADSPLPSIAAVHGVALAGGFELLQACDLVVVADDARIGDMHATWGLFPGGGGTQRLPRQLGLRRANWLLFSGEPLDPREAWAAGFVNAVVPADRVADKAREMAAVLANRSPVAIAGLKKAVRLGLATGSVQEGLAVERAFLERHMATKDVRIGVAAFHNRTTPSFVGD